MVCSESIILYIEPRLIGIKKMGFFRYISRKRNTRQSVGQLVNEVNDLVKEDTWKVEFFNAFFASVFTAKANV